MDRTVIAFMLMALLVGAGVGFGLYLSHNSRNRSIRRERARDKLRRDARNDRPRP